MIQENNTTIQSLDDDEQLIAYLISNLYEGNIKDTAIKISEDISGSNLDTSNERGIHAVNLEALCKYSNFVKAIVDGDKENNKMFIVKNDTSIASDETVSKIVEWINYHKNQIPPYFESKPLRSSKFSVVLKNIGVKEENIQWYIDFMKMKNRVFIELLNSCNYMDMNNNNSSLDAEPHGGLLNYCCVRMACIIKGRSPNELKKILDSDGDSFLVLESKED